ncbi:PH-domain-containing protein [Rickenella mellea]|uniref:PH-domain-containing protein n=1 Tax=Rickenella mellea TaxID=50990 RepID=A0A4Y7QDE9_9AGAM|nr:PH-domain-containing protein [Rickenella mellea]
MSASVASSAAPPPTPQEISRKLSVHSRPIKTNAPPAPVSGTESDSDSVISPEVSPHAAIGGLLASTSMQQPLSSIAERRSGDGDGEETEDDEDEEDEGVFQANEKGTHRRADEESIIKTGYLWKKGERRKTWKKRWFVLRPAHLAFYKSSAEYQLLRLLDLSEIHSCTPVILKRHENSFGLVSPTRTYYLQAESPGEMSTWVTALNEAREALMNTSTQNSIASTPIPIPGPSTHDQIPTTPSPPSFMSPGHHPVTSESDSEDAFPTYSSPNAQAISPSKGPSVAPKDPSKMIISGYLMKCRSKRRNWRKRWFVLTGEKLVYSASHMDTKRQRVIDLSQILDALEYDLPSHPHKMNPGHLGPSSVSSGPSMSSSMSKSPEDADTSNHTFKIVTTKRSLLLCAPSEEEEIKWLSAVRALIARRSGPATSPAAGASGGNTPKTSLQYTGAGSAPGGSGVTASNSGHSRKRSTSAASTGAIGGATVVAEDHAQ